MPKLKKYCSILRFLEDNDKALYEVFDSLCIQTLLRPKGKANGVTFLWPRDSDYRKEIIDAAYGTNPEKALQMLKSLTLLDYLPQSSDFVTRRDDLPNALLHRVGVVGASDKLVKLSGGLELTKNAKFIPMEGRKLCVYDMTGKQKGSKNKKQKGKRMPLEGKLTGWTHSERNKKPNVTGGVQEFKKTTIREMLMADVVDAGTKPDENPFAERVMSFLKYRCLDKNTAPDDELARCLKPLPEMTYLCLLAYWEDHFQEFNSWITQTKGMYSCEKAEHKDNVNEEYLSVYGKCVELYYKGKDYDKIQADRRSARVEVAKSLGAHAKISAIRSLGAKRLWYDEIPVVTMESLLGLINKEESLGKKHAASELAKVMKELHCSTVTTRPKNDSDYEGTYSARSFKGDVALFLSVSSTFVRSNAYQYSPLLVTDAKNKEDGDLEASFVDVDGNIDDSPFNLLGKLFTAQAKRKAKACFLGHLS